MRKPELSFEEKMQALESRKKTALKRVDDDYYTVGSPHYRDNQRYSWAVNTITEQFHREKKDLEATQLPT